MLHKMLWTNTSHSLHSSSSQINPALPREALPASCYLPVKPVAEEGDSSRSRERCQYNYSKSSVRNTFCLSGHPTNHLAYQMVLSIPDTSSLSAYNHVNFLLECISLTALVSSCCCCACPPPPHRCPIFADLSASLFHQTRQPINLSVDISRRNRQCLDSTGDLSCLSCSGQMVLDYKNFPVESKHQKTFCRVLIITYHLS